MSTQYDKLARDYRLVKNIDLEIYCYQPTLIHWIGRLTGQSVIDLACGSGQSTEIIKKSGKPRSIVGIDISVESIKIAEKQSANQKLNIRYYVGDVADFDFSKFKKFNVAVAWFLLHYAKNRKELEKMCENIYSCLKPGGQLITIIGNPQIVNLVDKNLGVSYKIQNPNKEGSVRWFDYIINKKRIGPFKTYYWKKSTYLKALTQAGFKQVIFSQPLISQKGLKNLDLIFGNNLLKHLMYSF